MVQGERLLPLGIRVVVEIIHQVDRLPLILAVVLVGVVLLLQHLNKDRVLNQIDL